jgi:disulfide bond formation protein DsbB
MNTTRLATLLAAFAFLVTACTGNLSATSTTVPLIVGPGDPLTGAESYEPTCSACHAPDLSGVSGLGGPLAPNSFVSEGSENEIADLIIEGVPRDDPGNTTGVDMAPRGGNPLLTDQDIQDIAAYLKTRN